MSTPFTEDDIYDFLKQYEPEHQQEGDITNQIAREVWGMSDTQTARRLNELVKKGVLTRIDRAHLSDGHTGTIWRMVKNDV